MISTLQAYGDWNRVGGPEKSGHGTSMMKRFNHPELLALLTELSLFFVSSAKAEESPIREDNTFVVVRQSSDTIWSFPFNLHFIPLQVT